ncbi:hypothetical protein [Nocardioides sp. AX2bis]|uniref:hypothetical protein n=1 Tax=Nocardioides sp. AX2bis TaxID=2653157 RepID=UPI0012F26ED6|nr:hypothetical protein [Nocardioides sp. AX2bis]VXC46917.1 conserved hypothetical protein [Nocardioides sp. AX2bis]
MTPNGAGRRTAHGLAAATLVAVLATGLAGCGAGQPDGSAGEPDAVEATPRSLVAAVEEHLGRPAAIAAPLYAGDFYGSEKPPRGTLAVEVAFDEEVGDNSHLQLLVIGGPSRYSRSGCEPGDEPEPCVQDTTDDGDERVLTWEQAAVESDPGVIFAMAKRDGGAVVARYQGQEVPESLAGSDLEPLADAMLALVADPAVGFRTSQAYADAGGAVSDAVMLDWYGQGNGAPPPAGFDPSGS